MAEIRVSNSYKSKDEFKLNAQWLKNATRTLGSNAGSVIKDISPNISGVVESASQITRTFQRNKASQNLVTRAIENNKYIKMGRTALDNAAKDLKSGNFDNSSREFSGSGSSDSTSYHFGDMDDGAEAGQIQTVVNFNPEGLNSINESITKQTKLQIKAAKANVDAVVATSSAMMTLNQKNAEASLAMLTNINNSLQALVKYNNENMSNFISSSMTYYEMMGKIYAPKEKQKSDRLEGADIFGVDGTLKSDKLSKLLKQNFKDNYAMSMPGQLMSTISNFGDQIVSNPLKIVSEVLMKKAIPDAVKKATENLDKTFGNFITELLLKSSNTLRESTGNFASLKRFLGNTLNINVDRRDKFETGGKVTTDAAVFDGVTRNAITAEIPKYLRESTAYLRQLVSLNGGDPDKAIAGSQVFNKATGRYQRYDDFTKDLMNSINESVINSMKRSEFGQSLKKVHKSDLISDDQKDAFEALMNNFYLALEKDDRGRLDISKRGADSDIGKIIGKLEGDENLKRILEESVYQSFQHGRGGINLNSARITAKKKRNEAIESLEELNLADLSALVKPDQNIDDAMASVIYGTDGKSTKNRAYTPNSLLGKISNIEYLLDRGINVKVLKGARFKSKISNGGKDSDEESTSDASPRVRTEPSNSETQSSDNLSAEELARRIAEAQDDEQPNPQGKKSKFIVNAQNSLGNMMHSILKGDINRVYGEMGNLFGQGLTEFGRSINDAVLQPVQKIMFGEDENGQAVSVASKVKDMFTGLKTDIADFVLGPKDESGKRESRKSSLVGFLKDGMNEWSKAIFGEDKTIDDIKENLKTKLKENSDTGLKGAVAGAGISLASGGILGSIVGGPITGALLGTASSFIFKSKGFQKLVFGEDTVDDKGNPIKKGGLISDQNQKFLKEHKTDIVGSAAIGSIGGMLTGGGLLGSLVGGPLAGAVIGSAVGIAKNSKTFKEFIFGKEEGEGDKKKRIGGILGAFNKAFEGTNKADADTVKKAARSLGSRATVGTAGGLLLSLFTPLGPVGGAALGLAASMASSKDKFHDLLFGKEDDKGDNKGLINRLGAQISKTVIAPLAGIAANALTDVKDAVLDKVLDPIITLAEPLAGLTRRLYDKVSEKVSGTFDKIQGAIMGAAKGAFSALTGVIGRVFNRNKKEGLVGKVGKWVGNKVGGVSDAIRASNEKASSEKWFSEEYRTSREYEHRRKSMEYDWETNKDGVQEQYGSFEKYEEAMAKTMFYNGGDTRKERKANRLARKEESAKAKQERKEQINREMLITKLTHGKYSSVSDEALEAAMTGYTKSNAYKKKKGMLGLSDDEVMRLLTPGDATSTGTKTVNQQLEAEQAQLETLKQQLSTSDKILAIVSEGFSSIIGAPLKGINKAAHRVMDNALARQSDEEDARLAESETNNMYRDRVVSQGERLHEKFASDDAGYSIGFSIPKKDRKKLLKALNKENSPYNEYARVIFDSNSSKEEKQKAYDSYKDYVKRNAEANDDYKIATARARRDYADTRRNVKDLKRQVKRGYATGTPNARPGVAVVGENGPEIVRFEGGEKVFSNNETTNVRLVGVAPGVSQDVNISGQNGPIVVYPTAAKLDGKTDNKSQIEKALSKPNSLVNYNQIKADNDELGNESGKEEKEEKGLLDSIMDSLGGIGKVLLGGVSIAGLLKLLSSDTVQDILGKLGEGIGDSAETITNVATNDGYDGGADLGANVKNQTSRWASIIKNPSEFLFGADGNADGQTSSFLRGGRQVAKRVLYGKQSKGALNAILHPVKTAKNAIRHPFTTMKNIGGSLSSKYNTAKSFIKSGDKLGFITDGITTSIKESDAAKQTKMITNLFDNFKSGGGLKGAQSIVSESIDSINPDRKGILGMLQTISEYGTKEATEETVENSAKSAAKAVAKNTAKESAENIVEKEARDTILKGAGKAIKEGLSKAGEVIASKLKNSKGANIIKSALKFVDEGLDVITKGMSGKFKSYIVKKLSKLGSILGVTGTVAATGVGALAVLAKDGIFLTLGALNAAGKGGTARLFRCDQSVVDWKMRIISAAIGGFAETTVGTVIDIVNEIYCALTGDDFLTRIATALYAGIASEEDEKILSDSQKQLEVDYNKYKEDVLAKEYKDYLEDNPGSNISLEEYKKKVASGEIKADVMGFAEYNDDRNKTVGAKVWNGTVGTVKKGWDNVKNFFSGGNGSKATNIEGGMGSSVPFYSQKDPRWNNLPYERGGYGETMGTTGCGPTAFAMAASGATGRNIDPVEAASAMKRVGARDETGTNWGGIGKAASMYGINSKMERNPSAGFVDSQLDAGNPVILSGRSGGYGMTPYTPQGHYVVATGRDANGNYIVNDPNTLGGSRKYKKSAMLAETGAAWGFGGKGKRGGKGGSETRAKWLSIVQAVKQAIAGAKVGYYGTDINKYIDLTIGGKKLSVRTDCSGFVSTCLKLLGVLDSGANLTSGSFLNSSANTLVNAGFTSRPFTDWNSLTPGDIVARQGHVEIFASMNNGKPYVYNCGSTSSCNSPGATPAGKQPHTIVWSPDSANASNAITSFETSVDGGVNGDAYATDATTTTTQSSGSSMNVFDKITTFFSELGSRALEGLTNGGNYNTDWSGVFGDSPSTSTTTDATIDGTTTSPSVTTDATASSSLGSFISPNSAATGAMNEKSLWDYLTKTKKFNNYAAAGIMGNWFEESGLRTNNVQNSYESKVGNDAEYTAKVDNGTYTNFAKDSAGYGLSQWTYHTRKQGLLDYARQSGKSISNEDVQKEYFWNELTTKYKGVKQGLDSATSVKQASDLFMLGYEQPGDQSESAKNKRASNGMSFYNKYAEGGAGDGASFDTTSTGVTNALTRNRVVSSDNNDTSRIGEVIHYLSEILSVLGVSSDKLNALSELKNLGNIGGQTVNNNSFYSQTTNTTAGNGGHVTASKTNPYKYATAEKIALGGL